MDRNEVDIAFEIVMEEIEAVANGLNGEGSAAFDKGDIDRARQVIEDATRLAGFRDKVKALQQEWQQSFPAVPRKKARRMSRGRLPRGLRTPEDAFRGPLLQSLVERGGSADMNDVLEQVGRRMRRQLNEYDREPVPSDPNSIRWRNTAQWCRHTLVREGLMKSDSPRGLWEITAAGRKAAGQQ
jgi:restriction system protein